MASIRFFVSARWNPQSSENVTDYSIIDRSDVSQFDAMHLHRLFMPLMEIYLCSLSVFYGISGELLTVKPTFIMASSALCTWCIANAVTSDGTSDGLLATVNQSVASV